MKYFLAFDLGASSGRAILGSLGDDAVDICEVHRFENGGVQVGGGLYWNLLGLFGEMKEGLRKALAMGVEISGMAIDTWGVDYALLDRKDNVIGFPRHYRDNRTTDILDYAFRKAPRERFYSRTGIQFMNFNTIFQLLAMQRDGDPCLEAAETMLMIPDVLTYLFCGRKAVEYTIASTSQAYDPFAKDWAWDLIDELGLPRGLFPEIVPPCTMAGELSQAICEELNCAPVPVIHVGSHDTASAVAAVPATGETPWAYLSSGTWSLFGIELNEPLVSNVAMEANYTNEGGIGGRIRFLKNIMGLWLVQESRNEWARQGQRLSFEDLSQLAAKSEPLRSLVDPNDDGFVAPGDMPGRIAQFCQNTDQPVPVEPGQVVRCALESLALRYRQALEEIEEISGQELGLLHLVGGGSQDELLNQFTANALQIPVVAGPIEATAIGNIIAQGMAVGAIPNLDAARKIVRDSVKTTEYLPKDEELWQHIYPRYRSLARRG